MNYIIPVNQSALESHVFCEEVRLEDFILNENGEWVLECRCGGVYKVLSEDLECGFTYFFCSNCSLKIKVLLQ